MIFCDTFSAAKQKMEIEMSQMNDFMFDGTELNGSLVERVDPSEYVVYQRVVINDGYYEMITSVFGCEFHKRPTSVKRQRITTPKMVASSSKDRLKKDNSR